MGEESLDPVVVAYSPSNVISTLEEHPMLDPIVYSWLNCSSASGEFQRREFPNRCVQDYSEKIMGQGQI
jgi:hypothetical protein